jgi:hypothetical protein
MPVCWPCGICPPCSIDAVTFAVAASAKLPDRGIATAKAAKAAPATTLATYFVYFIFLSLDYIYRINNMADLIIGLLNLYYAARCKLISLADYYIVYSSKLILY